jgi:outer membrane protein assembly factor BamA
VLAFLLLVMVANGGSPLRAASQPETVAEIRVHGNVITTDEDVMRLAGIGIGAAVTPATAGEVAARLRAAHRFQHVEVLKRFASIADPSQIVLVIIVDEGPVTIEKTGDADAPTRVVKTRGPNLLYFPILDAEDGYGLTYGVRLALADRVGTRSRVSFPLTWGGQKQAGAELDKDLDRGPLNRIVAGAAVSRRTNPLYDQDDDRRRVWIRGERQLARHVRAGAGGSWQHVSFAGADDRFAQLGADLVLDTRVDPIVPRNAVYARAAVERLDFASAGGMVRTQIDGRGYVGLFRQTVLALRAVRQSANGPLPPYEKLLLGGMENLRGFRAGAAAGDTLVAGSLELLAPLTSPLHVGRIGVSAFMDAGTVYDDGARFSDQRLKRGAGGSVWFSAAFVQLSVAMAHGIGASTRVHVGGTFIF